MHEREQYSDINFGSFTSSRIQNARRHRAPRPRPPGRPSPAPRLRSPHRVRVAPTRCPRAWSRHAWPVRRIDCVADASRARAPPRRRWALLSELSPSSPSAAVRDEITARSVWPAGAAEGSAFDKWLEGSDEFQRGACERGSPLTASERARCDRPRAEPPCHCRPPPVPVASLSAQQQGETTNCKLQCFRNGHVCSNIDYRSFGSREFWHVCTTCSNGDPRVQKCRTCTQHRGGWWCREHGR